MCDKDNMKGEAMESIKNKAIWNKSDVMAYLGCGRYLATKYMRMPSCPTIDKSKNAQLRVPQQAFINWVEGGMK